MSVDWIVLTAGIVGLAVTAAVLAETGILGLATTIVTQMISFGS